MHKLSDTVFNEILQNASKTFVILSCEKEDRERQIKHFYKLNCQLNNALSIYILDKEQETAINFVKTTLKAVVIQWFLNQGKPLSEEDLADFAFY